MQLAAPIMTGIVASLIQANPALTPDQIRTTYIQTLTLNGDCLGFWLYDREAASVTVRGSWNNWHKPGLLPAQIEPGVWHAWMPRPEPGLHVYKYLLDDNRWLTDPGNPARASNNLGGRQFFHRTFRLR